MSTTFTTDLIRNVAVTGHSDTGKTSLVAAMLLNGGAVNRLLKVDDGNTITDFDEDEHERKITINTAIAHFEHRGNKVNLIDTPGYSIYTTDALQGLRVADASLLLISAVSGSRGSDRQAVEVGRRQRSAGALRHQPDGP